MYIHISAGAIAHTVHITYTHTYIHKFLHKIFQTMYKLYVFAISTDIHTVFYRLIAAPQIVASLR